MMPDETRHSNKKISPTKNSSKINESLANDRSTNDEPKYYQNVDDILKFMQDADQDFQDTVDHNKSNLEDFELYRPGYTSDDDSLDSNFSNVNLLNHPQIINKRLPMMSENTIEVDIKNATDGSRGHPFLRWDAKEQDFEFEDQSLNNQSDKIQNDVRSFQLIGTNDEVLVRTVKDFIDSLGCDSTTKLKVVTVFGENIESLVRLINQTFHHGEPIFEAPLNNGVMAAYCGSLKVIVLMIGEIQATKVKSNPNTWTLLKMMALSDVVMYHVESLRSKQFLVELSIKFMENYGPYLEKLSNKLEVEKSNIRTLCPDLLVIHDSLEDDNQSYETFSQIVERSIEEKAGFSHIFYSTINFIARSEFASSYDRIRSEVERLIFDRKFRYPRKPIFVFRSLQRLTTFFEVPDVAISVLVEEFFTCRVQCEICKISCAEVSNHERNDKPHFHPKMCFKQNDHQNSIFYCKMCFIRKNEKVKVIPKVSPQEAGFLGNLGWSGYILDCKNCGQIYNSKKYWFGNLEPESTAIIEHQHVWPYGEKVLQECDHSGRVLFERMSHIGEMLAQVGSAPVGAFKDWATDRINPQYWEPNTKNCILCNEPFGAYVSRHHCRYCGKCVCHHCSRNKKYVPEKGWGSELVRVCDLCYKNPSPENEYKPEVTVTQIVPKVLFTSGLKVLSTAIKYPLDAIKESVRPSYWMKDEDIHNCCYCKREFNIPVKALFGGAQDKDENVVLSLHHCRGCGHGVCDDCSCYIRVPSRGWKEPVRVCRRCSMRKDL